MCEKSHAAGKRLIIKNFTDPPFLMSGGFFIYVNILKHPLTYALKLVGKHLLTKGVMMTVKDNDLVFSTDKKSICFIIAGEEHPVADTNKMVLHEDQVITSSQKIAAIIASRLNLNNVVYARSCEVRKVTKQEAADFLNTFHVLKSTRSNYNMALYFKDQIVALASFSKGRKMDRLMEHERSYELIRFCCREGISVTGGLTKLVKNFCRETKAGDVMTYIDKQLSDGKAFIKVGFIKHSETEPVKFYVNKKTFERIPFRETGNINLEEYYLSQNSGNIKLLYRDQKKMANVG